MVSKSIDIIVWGATGFTGRLTLRYLSSVARKNEIKIAVGGRSKEKLERVLQEEGIACPVIVANADDESSLVSMVRQSKVVVSLVGPYARYGSSLVKACAENGVHYCDLTGEPGWMARMISTHSRAAIDSKAIIIHASGYDSVPSDLCAFLAVQRLKNLAGPSAQVGEVKAGFQLKGAMSGGTLLTILDSLSADPETRKVSSNPYALSPIPGKHKPRPQLVYSSQFEGRKTYGAFWLMGPTNSAVVRRTWGLLESADPSSRFFAYGPEFSYNEFMTVANPIKAAVTSFVLFMSVAVLALFKPARWLLGKYGPQPGTGGPSEEIQVNGWFKVTTTATTVDKKHQARVVMKGKGDPGYAATAKMIAEAALTIVKNYDDLTPLARQGGHLTPATALGNAYIERLKKTGFFEFEVIDGK